MKKSKIIGIFGVTALLVVTALPVFAKSGDDDVDFDDRLRAEVRPLGVRAELRTEVRVKREEMHDENEQEREDLREEIKDERDALKDKIDAMRVDVKEMKDSGATQEEIKAKVEEVRNAFLAEREAFRVKIEEKRKTLRDDIKAQIESFKEGVKIRLSEEARVHVKERLDNAFAKLNDALSKLAGFDERISNEIASRSAKGLDTTGAEAALELARQSLEEAKVSVEAVSAAVSASIDSDTGASKEAIKSVVTSALESIKTAKTKYQDVIRLLPKVEVNTTASTTVDSN